jgi:mannose-6-phosphate isomerase-like protein (cupin superfamily)
MNATQCMISVVKSLEDYQVYRISPDATNRLAIVFDRASANVSLTVCVEIFDVGGKQPPKQHQWAVEMFFILRGEGLAHCDGRVAPIQTGDSLLVPPNSRHFIENTGSGRLYTLCIMVPNEHFAEMIRSGIEMELDEEDLAVLRRTAAPV